jgi:hypothetical protein
VTALFTLSSTLPHDPAVDAWLDAHYGPLGAIARTWFTRMRRCGPDVRETMHDGCPVACIEDVPFAYVNVFATHVNVGFFYGAFFDDPDELLQGEGKRMRHVKLRPGVEVRAAALNDLIDDAYADVRRRLAER